jgi:hypothetical protein
MAPLILKRASASWSSGQWSDDDYDVLENGKVVGRNFLPAAPAGRQWMWASGPGGHIERAAHGYEPTREAAMVVTLRAGDGRSGVDRSVHYEGPCQALTGPARRDMLKLVRAGPRLEETVDLPA